MFWSFWRSAFGLWSLDFRFWNLVFDFCFQYPPQALESDQRTGFLDNSDISVASSSFHGIFWNRIIQYILHRCQFDFGWLSRFEAILVLCVYCVCPFKLAPLHPKYFLGALIREWAGIGLGVGRLVLYTWCVLFLACFLMWSRGNSPHGAPKCFPGVLIFQWVGIGFGLIDWFYTNGPPCFLDANLLNFLPLCSSQNCGVGIGSGNQNTLRPFSYPLSEKFELKAWSTARYRGDFIALEHK